MPFVENGFSFLFLNPRSCPSQWWICSIPKIQIQLFPASFHAISASEFVIYFCIWSLYVYKNHKPHAHAFKLDSIWGPTNNIVQKYHLTINFGIISPGWLVARAFIWWRGTEGGIWGKKVVIKKKWRWKRRSRWTMIKKKRRKWVGIKTMMLMMMRMRGWRWAIPHFNSPPVTKSQSGRGVITKTNLRNVHIIRILREIKKKLTKSVHISFSQFNSQSYLQKMNFKKTNLQFCIKVFSNIWEEI